MLRSVKRGLLALAAITAAAIAATNLTEGVATGDVLRPLPNPSASQAPPTTGGLTSERIRQSLATVEVAGHATGIAVILDGDGRLITSLTAVGANDAADVRYADGHVVHAHAAHKDRVLDLALLVPLSGRYTTGLLPSDKDPMTVELRTGSLATGHPAIIPAKLKDRIDAHAKDGTSLSGAWELDHAPPSGAPLLDPEGRGLGIAGHACRNAAAGATTSSTACVDATVIIPILSIRIFLSHTPANAVAPSPWLGINGTADTVNGIRGVRVQAVAPRSPAEHGGLHTTSDLIVVADGQPLDTPERLAEIVSKHAVGDTLKLSVFAGGHYREVDVVLQAAP
jgi:serine protease Do